MDKDILAYVQRSDYRKRVLRTINNEVLMPKEISDRSGIRIHHISKVLGELRKKELIELINPEVRKRRIYRLTEKGHEILNVINED